MRSEVTAVNAIAANLDSDDHAVVAKALSDIQQMPSMKRQHGSVGNSDPNTSHFKESTAADAQLREIIPPLTRVATSERFSENISIAEEVLVDIGKRAIPELTRVEGASDWRLCRCLCLLQDIAERWDLGADSLHKILGFAREMCQHKDVGVAEKAYQCVETITDILAM